MNHLDSYIVYLDDAQYAHEQLRSLLRQPQIKRFVLVACAPRMTRRIGKWLSHSARENWRDKWCEKLFSQAMPMFRREDHVFCEVATGPLPEYTEMIMKDLGHATVIDARRPKFGVEMQPVQAAPAQPAAATARTAPAITRPTLTLPGRIATA
jgi:hypothetical protein